MTDIILDRFLTNSDNASTHINRLIENKDEFLTNPYKVISSVPYNNLLFYFFLIIIIYALFRGRDIRVNEIFVFLVCVLLIYMLSNHDYNSFIKFTRTKKDELKFLNNIMFNGTKTIKGDILNFEGENGHQLKKSFIYYDPYITSLMYNLREYTQHNIQSYSSCLQHINAVLKISFESSDISHNFYENYQSMIMQKKRALNELTSSIYSIQTTSITYEKFKKSITLLHQLLNAHILKVSKIFIDKVSTNEEQDGFIPKDFFQVDELISPNDLQLQNYQPTFNLY